MKKIDEEKIFKLAQVVESIKVEADKVNIGPLPKDDIKAIVFYNMAVKELLSYILDYEISDPI